MSKTTQKRESFTDTFAKLYKKHPGPGAAKEIDKGYKVLGSEVFSTKKKE